MSQFAFGSGNLWGTQLTDTYGNAITTANPVKFGTLQDISIDISKDVKELYGQNAFPVDVSTGKAKIAIKAKSAQIFGALYNSLFFGQTLTTGQTVDYADSTGSVIPATPYQVTPTPPSSGTWGRDLGVINGNGDPLTRLASGTPATGQYTVSAGVYTFSSADAGTTVFINYQYTISASGKTMNIVNVPMGYSPTFSMDILVTGKGKSLIYTFPQCISSKLSLATKLDDYAIPEFDISAFANAAGQVCTISTAE